MVRRVAIRRESTSPGEPMGLLDASVCIVTGAGQGIGRAVAFEMAREGATLALIERTASTLAETAAEIAKDGGTAAAYTLDVTDYTAYQTAVEDILRRFGKVDVLVNNAAINPPARTILDDTLDEWRRTIAVNLEAVYWGCKLVAPHMARQRSGRIVGIASIQGFAASGGVGAYNAAKGGMIGLTKSLSVELGAYDILVNAVAPGFISTPMSVIDGENETETPEFEQWYVTRGRIPLRRAGRPDDVSGTVLFLASRYCRYMTGQVLVVDGGLTSTF